MNFKNTIFALFLVFACVILNTKNPFTNSFSDDTLEVLSDAQAIEDTAISVGLSFADFPKILAENVQFISPVSKPIVTSTYGNRIHPITNVYGFHTGIDVVSQDKSTIFAVADGQIIDTGFDEIYGNYIKISHDDGYQSFYAHLSEIFDKTQVSQGEIIGIIGDTGLATSTHLHFEISKDDELLDPITVINFYEN